jgi:two-component system chemotaxis sensor kinase CheA
VPLSLSSHHLLMVRCRGRTYGIPTHAIVRLLRVRPVDLETIDGRPVIRVDGEPVPLAALSALLGVDEGEPLAADRKAPLVVLAAEGRRAAISVDALLDARPALVKALPGNARHDPTVDGVVVGDDDAVILVLRAGELVSAAERRPGVALPAAPPEAEAPRVLVVDDSITTRTLEKGVLEAGGFRVRLAVDGDEALAMLRADPVDLVVADLQMPRMDGFTLLQEMKRHRDLARIPVVIVSSLDSAEDRARGLALGADAYIAKLRFDSQDLLDTVRQLL